MRALPGEPTLANDTEPVGLAELAHKGVLGADDNHAWDERAIVQLLIAAVDARAYRTPARSAPLLCDCRITTRTPEQCRTPRARGDGPAFRSEAR